MSRLFVSAFLALVRQEQTFPHSSRVSGVTVMSQSVSDRNPVLSDSIRSRCPAALTGANTLAQPEHIQNPTRARKTTEHYLLIRIDLMVIQAGYG